MRSFHKSSIAGALCLILFPLSLRAVESVGAHLLPIIYEHGVDVAIADYYELRRTHRSDFSFGENELNLLGYRLLRDKRFEDAVEILKLNIEMYPLSANAHDSLAEAYMRMGESGLAKREYMRALSMLNRRDSGRAVGRTFLERNIRNQLARIELYPLYEPLVGIYRAEDGRVLSIAIMEPNHGYEPPRLRMVEFPSGLTRTLHKKSNRSYWTGPGLDLRSPVEERFDFIEESDDEVSGIRIRTAGEVVTAGKAPLRNEPVTFHNGEVELEGTLVLPDSESSRPAVVLVHGSGNATRNAPGFGELSHFLALNGYAVLRYDKRGWGDSSMGETRTPMLRDLAGDAMAAYQYLASRGDIDPDRIGIAGFSEGAWVAGITAASRAANPTFVVLLSGGAVEPWRQELYRVEAELRAEEFSDESVEDALAFMNAKFDVARTGAGWSDFTSAMRSNRRKSWYKYAFGWPSARFAQVAWNEVLGYEPATILESVHCPVLAFLGEKDLLTPPEQTKKALQKAFTGNREVLLRIVTLPSANHLLMEAEKGSIRFSDELASTKRYAPGFFETFGTWLAGRPGGAVTQATTR